MSKASFEKENKMGTQPINSLLISMALPLMISMVIQALYNVVDSIYVAQMSQNAFNAVAFAFPIQNIINAIGNGTGIGVSALISRSLGEKNKPKANSFALNGLFLAICSFVVIAIVGFFCAEPFMRSQTDIEDIITQGISYIQICCCLSFGVLGQVILERILQSTGKTMLSMYTQGTGAIVNIILDPILIFGYFGLPALGVTGAALATVIGQMCSLITGLLLNIFCNKELSFKIKGFKPQIRMIGTIYKIGLPSILMISVGSVMTYLMNRLLNTLEVTGTAAAVFGVFFKLQSFVLMPILGLAHAMLPIASYNLGALNKKRLLSVYKLSLMYAFGYAVIGTTVLFFFPDVFLSMFDASEEMLAIGTHALRITSFSFLFASFGIVSSNLFQACAQSLISMFISLARQLVVLIPLAYLLGYTIGLDAVWFAIPAGEASALFLMVVGLIIIKKKILNKLPD